MSRIFIGYLRGATGATGPMGPVNPASAPADTAVGEWIGTTGISATKSALVDFLSINSPQTRQAWLYGEFLRKLRANEAQIVAVRGDSIVYGQDTISGDKVAAAAGALPDGTFHSATRSPQPYPTVLQARLREVYGTNVTVVNQGYSGDYVKRGYDRWLSNAGAGLTIIHYGINDATAATTPSPYLGNVQLHIEWLERMILRDIGWGSAVALVSATKQQGWVGSARLDVFRQSLVALASKYGIPIIDGEQFTAGYGTDIYSDAVHFNTAGYDVVGSHIGAAFVGQGPHAPFRVTSGSVLATRPSLDNVVVGSGFSYSFITAAGTPPEGGNAVGLTTAPDAVANAYFGFYTSEPDVLFIPMIYTVHSGTGSISWSAELDFNVAQPDNMSDYSVGQNPTDVTTRASKGIIRSITTTGTVMNYLQAGFGGSFPGQAEPAAIRIASPGWHVVKLSVLRSSGTTVQLHGAQFIDFQTQYLYKAIAALGG